MIAFMSNMFVGSSSNSRSGYKVTYVQVSYCITVQVSYFITVQVSYCITVQVSYTPWRREPSPERVSSSNRQRTVWSANSASRERIPDRWEWRRHGTVLCQPRWLPTRGRPPPDESWPWNLIRWKRQRDVQSSTACCVKETQFTLTLL